MTTATHQSPPPSKPGFTLVEILVVIVIIGILASVAIPAINNSIRGARVSSLRLEITALEQAIEQYQQKYGDYPPDFSSWAVVQRHYRKSFPRMSTNDSTLLYFLLHDTKGTATTTDDEYQAAQIDRGEVLAWVLGGYSDDVQRPFTGPGGPLSWTGDGTNSYTDATVSDTDRQTPTNFQINIDRPNSLMNFEASRLDYGDVDPSALITGANRRLSGDGDLFLSYLSEAGEAPFVYFDSRTYAVFDPTLSDFNGYASPTTHGVVRPYLTTNPNPNTTGADYASDAAAMGAWQFVNPNTFQIICAGLDNHFGATASFNVDSDSTLEPVYFQFATGTAVAPRTDVDTPAGLVIAGVSKYQESTFGDTNQYPADNITNFSRGTLVDDVP